MTPKRSIARRNRWLVIASLVATVASVCIVIQRVPLGERKHWRQCYAMEHVWANIASPSLLLGTLCACTALGLGWIRRGRVRWAIVLALTALTFVCYTETATAGKYGVIELAASFMLPTGNGSYYCEAERIGPYYGDAQKRKPDKLPIFDSVWDYLDGYSGYQPTEIFPSDTMRVVTHPPGPSLVCYAVQATLRRWPELADALIRFYRRAFQSRWGEDTFVVNTPISARLFLAGATTVGLLTLLTASIAAPLTFWCGGLLRLARWAPLAFGLSALFPSLHLYSPGIDQCFPALALLLWATLLLAAQRRNAWLAGLSGVIFFACMGLSLAFAVPLALAAAAAGLWWLGTRAKALALRRGAVIACGFCVGFALLLVVAKLAAGYETFGTWARCYRNNKQFNIDSARGYWPWLLYNPIMFALFLGGPSVVLWLAGTCAAMRRTWRRGTIRGRDWLPLALAATLFLLWICGINRGEVERLWMFFMPICVLAGACGLCAPPGRWQSLALLLMQAAQVAVFRVCYDAWDFARYFSTDFLSR